MEEDLANELCREVQHERRDRVEVYQEVFTASLQPLQMRERARYFCVRVLQKLVNASEFRSSWVATNPHI